MTHDVDIVVALSMRNLEAFVEAFPLDDFYCPPEDVLAIEIRAGRGLTWQQRARAAGGAAGGCSGRRGGI
jgi:hypothetical protein